MVASRSGQHLDDQAMQTLYARRHTVEQMLSVLSYISIGTAGLALAVCVGLAVLRGRFAAALAAVVLVAGANVTTQVLKHSVIDRPDYGYLTVNSLPSGHTTVVTSIVLAALLVAGSAIRPFVVVLGTFAVTFIGASTLVAGWHRPGDAVAADAVCLAWGSALVLLLALRRGGKFARAPLTHTVAALVGTVIAGVLLIAIGVRPSSGWSGFADAAVVLTALGVVSAVTVGSFARLSSVHAL